MLKCVLLTLDSTPLRWALSSCGPPSLPRPTVPSVVRPALCLRCGELLQRCVSGERNSRSSCASAAAHDGHCRESRADACGRIVVNGGASRETSLHARQDCKERQEHNDGAGKGASARAQRAPSSAASACARAILRSPIAYASACCCGVCVTGLQIFETFEDPSYSAIAKWYSIAMMVLIVLATTCFVLESEAMIPSGALYYTDALVRPLRPFASRSRRGPEARGCLPQPARVGPLSVPNDAGASAVGCAREMAGRVFNHRDGVRRPLHDGVRHPSRVLPARATRPRPPEVRHKD